MPNSASAIVTAAEPIWATFPARASKSGCRAANRSTDPLSAASANAGGVAGPNELTATAEALYPRGAGLSRATVVMLVLRRAGPVYARAGVGP